MFLQTRLLVGRHLAYSVEGATEEEEKWFVTLIRFTPRYPRGRATALLNWQCSAIEVAADEQPVLVLLLLVALSESIREMRGVNRLKPFKRVALPLMDESVQWDSIVACKCSLDKGKSKQVKDEKERPEAADIFCSEDNMNYWWNVGKCKKEIGAGNCGAGACGTSVQPIFI